MSTANRPGSPALAGRWMLLGVLLALAGCTAGTGQDGALGRSAHRDTSASGLAVSLRLARAAREAGDLTSAIQFYRDLAENRGAGPQVLVELGDTLGEAGLYDDAIEAYGRVDGGDARLDALLGLVRANMALGDAAAALKFADQALALAPQNARVLVDRGVALDALERHTEAQDSYRGALQITPRSVAARNNLALSLALTGQYNPAIAMMTPLARSASATPRIRENLALIFGLNGDSVRAAALSRMDLDEPTTAANLAFFARVRDAKP